MKRTSAKRKASKARRIASAVGKTIYVCIQCLGILAAGILVYDHIQRRQLHADIITSVDEHTVMNHGQKGVDITLPKGVTFTSFGDCSPHWKQKQGSDDPAYWDELSCNVEKFDSALGGYKPVPFTGKGWVEDVP